MLYDLERHTPITSGYSVFKKILPIIIVLTCTACSSVEKVTHYEFKSSEDQYGAKLSYEPTTVFDAYASSKGFPVKIIYKKKFRLFQVNHYQYARIKFEEYGNKVYTMGPLLLPVIPLFGFGTDEKKINMESKLSFTLSFSSDPIFEDVTAQLPNLEIIDSRGKLLKPFVEKVNGEDKKFTYETKIGDTPWFILQEAEIKLSNGKILKIPKIKFELGSNLEVNWVIPFGP